MTRRRKFLQYFLSSSLGAFFISVAYPVIRFMTPPDRVEAVVLKVTAARSEEIAPNAGVIFRFGTRPGLLIRTPSGEPRAFAATCTHLDCTVQYRPEMQDIYCACHEGLYDLNGTPTSGPPPRPLEQYTVNEANGDIVVSKGVQA